MRSTIRTTVKQILRKIVQHEGKLSRMLMMPAKLKELKCYEAAVEKFSHSCFKFNKVCLNSCTIIVVVQSNNMQAMPISEWIAVRVPLKCFHEFGADISIYHASVFKVGFHLYAWRWPLAAKLSIDFKDCITYLDISVSCASSMPLITISHFTADSNSVQFDKGKEALLPEHLGQTLKHVVQMLSWRFCLAKDHR